MGTDGTIRLEVRRLRIDGVTPALMSVMTEYSPLATLSELRRKDRLGSPGVHLVAVAGDVPVGLLPVYLVAGDTAAAVLPSDLALPGRSGVILLGSRVGFGNALTVRTGTDPGTAAAIVAALLADAAVLAAAAGCDAAVALHLEPDQRALLPAWTAGWSESRLDTAVLDVGWRSFDEYVAALPRQRRSHVRAERRRFLAAGHTVRAVPLAGVVDQVAPLLAATQRKYGEPDDVAELADYLRTTAAAMGPDGTALLVYAGDRPAGFTSIWARPTFWYLRAWGSDEQLLGTDGYFNGYLYEPLIGAMAAGVERLYLSSGSLTAKCRRGAHVLPLHTLAGRLPPTS